MHASNPASGQPRLPPIRRTDERGQFRPDRTDQYIGLQIRTGRRLMGLSRNALAEPLGISVPAVAAYEHGVREVPVLMLAQIAEVLNKPLAWFYHRSPSIGRLRDVPKASVVAVFSAPPAAPAASDQRPCVLLVDDAPDVLVTLGAFLEGAGLRVIKARSGDEALRIVAGDEALHAIVTDNAMPGLSGIELLLQSTQLRPSVPGLIVTGYADVSGLGELPGTVEVLCKPFRREDLVRRVLELTRAALRSDTAAPAVPSMTARN